MQTENAIKRKIYNARYYSMNPDVGRDRRAEKAAFYQLNKSRLKAAKAAYIKANAGIVNAAQARRYANKLRATVSWANHAAIAEIYVTAKKLGLEVDHVIPLQGKLVCGLHVEGNLQLLTQADNARKGNKFEV